MRKFLLLTIVLPLMLIALSGSECGTSSPTDAADGDPNCEQPVYDPDTRTVRAQLGEEFSYDVFPWLDGEDPHPPSALVLKSGELPPGLDLDLIDLATGGAWVIGIPSETGSWLAVLEATVTCEGGDELKGELSLTIEVVEDCIPIEAPTSIEINAVLGQPIVRALGVGGGIGRLSYSITGFLPNGVEFDGDTYEDPFVGFEGEASEEGTYLSTITVTDQCVPPQTVEIPVSIEIGCTELFGQPDIYIGAEVDAPISLQLDIVGGIEPYSFQLTGNLPPGVTFDGEFEVDSFTGFEGAGTAPGVWELDLTVTDSCSVPQSVVIPVTITITQPGATIPPGVYDCSLNGVEALWIDPFVNFGGINPPYCVGAGTNGWAILSLASPFFGTLASQEFSAYWGAIPLAGGPAGGGYTARAMFAFGPNGAAVTAYDGGWAWTAAWGFQAVSDACGLDDAAGAADRSGLSYCIPSWNRAMGVHYDEENNGFATYPGWIDGSSCQGGTIRSSCPLAAGAGDVFILTDADGEESGKLFHGDFEDPFVDCTYIADIGPQPVCVRKEGNIWAAADFTANTITCGLVNSGADATVTCTVGVGDGPFRIDLYDLGNGNTAVGCAGFNDNTFSVIVVDALGQLVSNLTQDLPIGISAPGSVVFSPDGSNNLIVGGNGTDNIAVVDTGL